MARRGDAEPTFGLILIRVVTGAVILVRGWRWVAESGVDGRAVRSAVDSALDDAHPLLHWWGENVLLTNPDAVGFFWRWTALACGLSLCLGAFTRPMGWLAVVFLAHALAYGPDEHRLLFLSLVVTCLGCAVAGAGRRMGLDAILDRRCPTWLTWTRGSPSSFLS